MSESSSAVTAGSGSNLRTDDKTISATTVKQQVVLQGDASRATYTAIGISCSLATSGDHLLIVQGDSAQLHPHPPHHHPRRHPRHRWRG